MMSYGVIGCVATCSTHLSWLRQYGHCDGTGMSPSLGLSCGYSLYSVDTTLILCILKLLKLLAPSEPRIVADWKPLLCTVTVSIFRNHSQWPFIIYSNTFIVPKTLWPLKIMLAFYEICWKKILTQAQVLLESLQDFLHHKTALSVSMTWIQHIWNDHIAAPSSSLVPIPSMESLGMRLPRDQSHSQHRESGDEITLCPYFWYIWNISPTNNPASFPPTPARRNRLKFQEMDSNLTSS